MINHHRCSVALLVVLLSLAGSSGCAFLGPEAVRGSRLAYNEAIVATNNQQVLAMIVHMRYGEPTGLLAVSSVTANMRVSASAGAQFGFGKESNYSGNLVPLTTGFAYDENPTISYAPVQGEQYLRQLLSPIPVDLAALVLNGMRNAPPVMSLLVAGINGIRNPSFLASPDATVDGSYARLAGVLSELASTGHLDWTRARGEEPSLVLAIDSGGAPSERIGELYELLGFAKPQGLTGVVTLPVVAGMGRPERPGVRLMTRSLFELFNLIAASVDVPPEHLESGIAPPLHPTGVAGAGMHIQRTRFRPREAITAVRHHGWWYSIDAKDSVSKATFRILESLMSVTIADAVDSPRSTPVLTVPVTR